MVEIGEAKTVQKIIKYDSNWPMVLLLLHLHVLTIFAVISIANAQLLTFAFAFLLVFFGQLGKTAGAHRLWTHRSYTADAKLRIFLMLCHTLIGEGTIYNWVLEHRLHHKHFGTALDPFNANKSLFQVHLVSKSKKPVNGYDELKTEIDMTDTEKDSIVMFQKKFYWLLYPIVVLLLPINAPAEYWDESLLISFYVIGVLRYLISLHLSWLVDSAVKIWGCEQNSPPILTELIEKKEWLSYHYVAPWDYQTTEFGHYGDDFTSKFIKFCADLGVAGDLKTMNGETVAVAMKMSIETNKPITECLMEMRHTDVKSS